MGSISPNIGDLLADSGDEGREPAELLARLYAHVLARLPFARKIEKKLEGVDVSSGPLSDLIALAVQLGKRNEEVVNGALAVIIQDFQTRRAEKPARGGRRLFRRRKSGTMQPSGGTSVPTR